MGTIPSFPNSTAAKQTKNFIMDSVTSEPNPFSAPFDETEEINKSQSDSKTRRKKADFEAVEVEEGVEEGDMPGVNEEMPEEILEESGLAGFESRGWQKEETRKKFEEVTEKLWGKREERKKPPEELMAEKRPTNEEWMQENELMQCLKLLRGEIAPQELQRRKAFFKYWDANENPADKSEAKPKLRKPENRRRPGEQSKDADPKKSGASFDKIVKDMDRDEKKKNAKAGHQVSWKMFWCIFLFYVLMGFKGMIWNYFFPKKK